MDSGSNGYVWQSAVQPRCLFDLRLLWGARRSLDLVRLLLVQFLLSLNLSDKLLDLLALRFHPLLREPLQQVHWQVEAGNRILYGKDEGQMSLTEQPEFSTPDQNCTDVQLYKALTSKKLSTYCRM